MEASKHQENFEGSRILVDIPAEVINENVGDIYTNISVNRVNKPLIEMETNKELYEEVQDLSLKTVEEIDENVEGYESEESDENNISKLQNSLVKNLLYLEARYRNNECMKELCQLLRAKIRSKKNEMQDSESELAESVQGDDDDNKSRNGNTNNTVFTYSWERDTWNPKSPLGNTLLHKAARDGNDNHVKMIVLETPHLLIEKNFNGDTALHMAAKAGHFSILKKLMEAHCSNSENLLEALEKIIEKNNQGNTFFHEALINGHKELLTFLVYCDGIKEVANAVALLEINNEKKSSLYLAIEIDFKGIIDHVLDEVIPKDKDSNYVPDGKSPLLAVITKRDKDILDTILTKRQEWIHLRDKKGRIPLHYAASIGYQEGVRYLLKKCAFNTMKRDKYGFFPIHLASCAGHVEVVKKLLKPKYCPNISKMVDNDGRSILHVAVQSGKFNVVRYILQAKNLQKMINDRDFEGNTPLHLATLYHHPKIVHALTWDKRVDLNLVNNNDETALGALRSQDNSSTSFSQRLVRLALISAGVQSKKSMPSRIKVPPRSIPQQSASNMDSYKDRIGTLILVSTLIITVTFTAGFTMPGGTNGSDPAQGMALMLNHIWFKLFIFCITISMYGATSVTIILIWAQLGDLTLAIIAIRVARYLLGITLATLSLAFLAAVHLVISDLSWLATSCLIISLVFTFMLLMLFTLLWFPSTSSNIIVRYMSYYPFLMMASLVESEEE